MSDPIFSVAGKVALVTGAAAGLGREMATALAENGAMVAQLDRDPCSGLGANALTLQADVTDKTAIEAAVAQTVARFGRLDILVANAGVSDPNPALLHETTDDDWNRVIDINLHGTFLTCRAALPQMLLQQAGKIITVASMWGLAAPAGLFPRPAYAASKGAIVNLTRELALQYARHNIQVNALCPGFFRTATRPRSAEAAAQMAAYTPMGRIANAAEIRGSLLYLASSASDFVTGTTLVVDGGVLAR
jgi:NAD(P)-dependent dehydrogenase (short-subunit alcohol dehydrogenase family)